jgi:hypothetical protein
LLVSLGGRHQIVRLGRVINGDCCVGEFDLGRLGIELTDIEGFKVRGASIVRKIVS